MKKILLLSGMMLVTLSLSAHTTIEAVLSEIERNNAGLAASRKLRDAQTVETRVGNSLENPEVEYAHTWGNPSSLGKAGELTLKQGFDFPTVYANRNKLAKIRAEQYGNEYAASRQRLLFEAKSICIDISALRQQSYYYTMALNGAKKIMDAISKQAEAGDANALDENKAKYEYIAVKNAAKMYEIELTAAENRLVNLNGGLPITYEGDAMADMPMLRPFDEMADKYMRVSPDMLALLSEKDAAERDVKLSRSMSLPKLALGYRFEHGNGERFNGVVMGMSIPMFGNRHNVKRAKAQAAVAEAEMERAKVDIYSTLKELYSKAELLSGSLSEYNDILDHADSVELLKKALGARHISVTEFYNQVQPVFDTYLTMIETKREYLQVCAAINMLDL